MATMTKTASRKGEKVLTVEVDVPAVAGRVKRVWRDSQECAHRWASGACDEGRAGSANVFFHGATIYSYGAHFPMAQRQKRVKGDGVFVLVSSRSYSVSTSSHQSDVRQAVRGQTTYTVDNVTAHTVAPHLHNLDAYRVEAVHFCKKAKAARTNRAQYEATAVRLITEANEYAEAVGLKERLTAPEGADGLEKWAASALAAEAAAEEKHKREVSKAAQKAAKELAVRVAEWEQRLTAWKDGGKDEPGRCPDSRHPLAELAFLRVKGSVLETSQRVAVPLKTALPVLAIIRSGKDWAPEIGSARVAIDGFDLRCVDQVAKQITIGCHLITFDEVERVAKTVGL